MLAKMKSLKKIVILISAFLISMFLVNAHSLYLFGISLDFDQELKSNIVKASQKFAKTTKEPLSFDLDKGLIMVHFEPEQRNYVEINPLNYAVHGMRNENLKHKNGNKKLTKEQGYEIAKKFFDLLPENVKSELKYSPEVSEVDNTYFYKWFRHINEIIVLSEDLMINVDAVNRSIIAWRLAVFDYPKDTIKTAPAISMNVAKRVAELTYNAHSVENFRPYLVIYGDELVWVNRLQGQFYPFYVGVSAEDGSIAFTGTLPGEIPQGYSKGSDLKVVETDLIKQIYQTK